MAGQDQPSKSDLPESIDGNGRRDKGKDKEPTLADRLQASGRLAVNSVTSAQPLPGWATAQKAAGSSSDSSRHESSASDTTALYRNRASGVNEPFRRGIQHSGEASQAFEVFAEPLNSRSTSEQVLLPQTLPRSLAHQESSDGYAVVDLLNQPDDEDESLAPDDQYDLSPETAASLRSALFGAELDASVWTGLLDFTPSFIARLDESSVPQLKQHLGTIDQNTARQVWAQQWADVLSSYTDEVWGDLGPLVSDAKREIDQLTEPIIESDKGPSGTPAVDRLRQILAHVRGHT